uniref:Formin binding protein 1 n=1 Tax=Takifugu rubripes TaxID=31033 RepID=A0A674MVF6_TAKRU
MSSNWGTELWDQFDSLEKHTGWGIDFLERYTKFIKERADIELSYAKQIRSLSKKYQIKRGREDESRYTWCLAFAATLRQLHELSIQKEELSENLNSQVVCELMRYTQELKTERKSHFQDGRRAQQHIENSWKQLETSKRRFERDCKEAERAQHICNRIDLDNKTDGEKAHQTAQQKKEAAEESRKDYQSSLSQFNHDQYQHYHTLVPVIYQRIQDMEERRIERICEGMRLLVDTERKVLPVMSRCLDAMMDAAESVQPRMDTQQVAEVYKSGFDPPGDVAFQDYSATIRRSVSESSYLDNRAEGRRQSKKRWPFIRKNKLLRLLSSPHQPPPPPPPPILPSPEAPAHNLQRPPPACRAPITQQLNDFMMCGSRTRRKQCFRSLKRGGLAPADCSHLPPEQRRIKLQSRINNISQEIQREKEQRDALLKMKEVYEQSPQMGDADSLEPRLEEVKQILQKLDDELKKNQVYITNSLSMDEENLFTLTINVHIYCKCTFYWKSCLTDSLKPGVGDAFDVLIPGQTEGTLSMVEGELLSVVEEDKGDGWTRVRRNLEEEGYVPTSYIKVFLESSTKGGVTYI